MAWAIAVTTFSIAKRQESGETVVDPAGPAGWIEGKG
jgi:hypothetical protein